MAAQTQKIPKEKTISGAKRANIIIKTAIASLAAAFAIFPIVYVFSASLQPDPASISDLFKVISFDNYAKLVTDPNFPVFLWIWNSVWISTVSAVIIVFLTAMAAYAFARLQFRGRRQGLLALILIQMFPNLLAIVSLYLLLLQFKNLGLEFFGLNSAGGLILIYSGGALGFNTFLMKGFFDTIPKELDESAGMDGATPTQIFLLILLPLVRPVLAVIGILAFIGTYGDFLLARIILQDKDKFTLAVGLNLLLDSGNAFNKYWGQFSAAAIVGALPIILIYLFGQKQLIGGLTAGSVKG